MNNELKKYKIKELNNDMLYEFFGLGLAIILLFCITYIPFSPDFNFNIIRTFGFIGYFITIILCIYTIYFTSDNLKKIKLQLKKLK